MRTAPQISARLRCRRVEAAVNVGVGSSARCPVALDRGMVLATVTPLEHHPHTALQPSLEARMGREPSTSAELA